MRSIKIKSVLKNIRRSTRKRTIRRKKTTRRRNIRKRRKNKKMKGGNKDKRKRKKKTPKIKDKRNIRTPTTGIDTQEIESLNSSLQGSRDEYLQRQRQIQQQREENDYLMRLTVPSFPVINNSEIADKVSTISFQ